MARSRNIKPGFFMNDKLAEVEPLGRILFAGLWCVADRKGRLEDRPKRIKAEILPYDNCNADDLLNQLANKGFIIRYRVDGKDYIQVINFTKHQNPHMNERDSEIPAPEYSHTSTIQAPCQHHTNPADSLNMIPDSLNTDDCPDIQNEKKEGEEEQPPTPYGKIKSLYNDLCPSLPQVRALSDTRWRYLRARWQQFDCNLAIFEEVFRKVEASDFCRGVNDRNWRADIDWLIKNDHNMTKVLEGRYDNKKKKTRYRSPEHKRLGVINGGNERTRTK